MTEHRELSPEDDTLADIADRIMHIARILNTRTLENPDIVPVSSLEALVLRHVDRHPGITSSQLAASLQLRTSNASTVLRSLVEKGLLRRADDPTDGRAVHVTLTPLARDSIAHLRAGWSGMLRGVLPGSSDAVATLAALTALDEALS